VTIELPVARVRAGLVARGDVLALARRRWAEAMAGAGQFLLIAGEAGIGKSRMLDEIADLLAGVPVLTTRAWPRDAEFPGAVLFDLARALRQEGRTEVGDAIIRRLRAVGDDRDGAARYRMLASDLTDLVFGHLIEEPLLLRVEDLHWSDELSLDVLERLAPLVRHSRSLVVATYRSDEVRRGSALATWRSRVLGQRFAEEVPLARLDRVGTVELATALLGETPSVTFVDDLVERSNGIPLYIEELIAAGGSRTVPETIAEAVRGRSERLDDVGREVAGAAAVIGCSFEFDLLVDIMGVPEDPVDSGLRELCDHHLLVRLSDTKFDFRHALLRDALYDDIPLPTRRRMHAAVAEASERAQIRRSYLSEQFELAQLPERAFPHAIAAAEDASRLSAHREAAELYARALRTAPSDARPSLIADLTAAGALELLAIDDADGAATLLARSIELSHQAGDADAAAARTAHLMATRHLLGDDLDQRIALARNARHWLAASADGGSDAAWGRLLGAEAAAYMLARRLERAIEAGGEALARLRSEPDPAARLDVQATLGAVQVFAGRDAGWALLEAVIVEAGTTHEAAATRGHRMLATSASVLVEYERARRDLDIGLAATADTERWNDHHYLRAHRAHVRWATGAAGADDDARRALADGRGVTTEIEARTALGYLDLARDRLDDACRHLERALQLGRGMAELQRINPPLWGLAEAALHGGDVAGAVELTEEGYANSVEVEDAAYLFPFVLTGVRGRLALHQPDGARDWLARCRALLELRGIPGTLPALGHAEGLLALADGRSTAARPLLREAADAWARRERLWEGVQALLDLARCAVRSRRPGEAARFVAEARRRAEDAGAGLLVRLADEVRLDADAGDSAGPLTVREFEVARLIAQGATNRVIAERLVIAPKTASAHVEHILAKLGVSRRAEVAAWVSRLDSDEPA
jgi:DNA-binding CsgD family transcriptional regulator